MYNGGELRAPTVLARRWPFDAAGSLAFPRSLRNSFGSLTLNE
jgi:hypothetical protein